MVTTCLRFVTINSNFTHIETGYKPLFGKKTIFFVFATYSMDGVKNRADRGMNQSNQILDLTSLAS